MPNNQSLKSVDRRSFLKFSGAITRGGADMRCLHVCEQALLEG